MKEEEEDEEKPHWEIYTKHAIQSNIQVAAGREETAARAVIS